MIQFFRVARHERPKIDVYPSVILNQDNWDDYGYSTLFNVTVQLDAQTSEVLGSVKILEYSQSSGYTPLPESPFRELSDQYCSLGQELSYYENLIKLGPDFYREYLTALGDVIFLDERLERFKNLGGFRSSLLRFGGASRVIKDARALIQPTGAEAERPARASESGLQFQFSTPLYDGGPNVIVPFDFPTTSGLPSRVNVLIGYNGVGKTRILSNLAVATSGYGYDGEEDVLNSAYGRFVDGRPPIDQVILVSYSAFDKYRIPTSSDISKSDASDDGKPGVFGYLYIGLREPPETLDDDQIVLKNQTDLRTEFLDALALIHREEKSDTFLRILKPFLKDASFRRIGLTPLVDMGQNTAGRMYDQLSSGHKIVLKTVAELVSALTHQTNSLVVFDEPEAHLHPPLLATLLRSVRLALDEYGANAVVATHSPVVLQETPSRFIRVIERSGNTTRVRAPKIETFGENIGTLTRDVFHLDEGQTDWYATLRELNSHMSVDEIKALFGGRLGLSARSYLAELEAQSDVKGRK